ncbi:MAG: hypothetical protein QNK42_05715 [Pseudodonghicola sp.]|nr:hypothetical protein [Pseudodonghicola sp.]
MTQLWPPQAFPLSSVTDSPFVGAVGRAFFEDGPSDGMELIEIISPAAFVTQNEEAPV